MLNYGRRLFKYLFVPCQANNYHPRTIQIGAIGFYIFFLIVFQGVFRVIGGVRPQILGFATDITVEGIFSLANRERIKNNISPLNYSEELSYAAEEKAKDMFEKNYWAHISPTGVTPWQFINHSGYNYVYAGENLAKDFYHSEDVVEAWMNSPTHRSNILKPEYTNIGIAVLNGRLLGRDTTLVVQEFGKKAEGDLAQLPSSREENIFSLKESRLATDKTVGQVAKFNFSLNRTASLMIAEVLLVALFIDSIYIWRKNIIRLTGKSIAHLIFIIVVIAAIGFTGAGVIL